MARIPRDESVPISSDVLPRHQLLHSHCASRLGETHDSDDLEGTNLGMYASLARLVDCCGKPLWNSLRDLLPIISTVVIFQLFVFRQPLDDVTRILGGLALVVCGLSLFVAGLEWGLFPLGEQMAYDFARKGSVFWLVAFAFALGFGTTFAEPALIAVGGEAAKLAIPENASLYQPGQLEVARQQYALVLRATVALAVGWALVLGVLRIITGWPLHWMIMLGYAVVICLTPFAPPSIIGVAYDSGGVTTSTITVPLTAALGVGLATSLKGRNPMLDGFGLIALASLFPIIFVLALGILRG